MASSGGDVKGCQTPSDGPGLHWDVAFMSYRATTLVALVEPESVDGPDYENQRSSHAAWRAFIPRQAILTSFGNLPIWTRVDGPPLLNPEKVHITRVCAR